MRLASSLLFVSCLGLTAHAASPQISAPFDPAFASYTQWPSLTAEPQIASGPTHFLVVFENSKTGHASAQLFSAAGELKRSHGLVTVSLTQPNNTRPAVAWDGEAFLVVWSELGDIKGLRIHPEQVAPVKLTLSTDPAPEATPSVACGGGTCLVSWYLSATSNPSVVAKRVTAGVVQETAPIVISSAQAAQTALAIREVRGPGIAFGGSQFLVAWQDSRSGSSMDVYANRVGTDGVVKQAADTAVSTSANHQGAPSVAFDGKDFVLVWHDATDVLFADSYNLFGTRISSSGALVDPMPFVVSNAGGSQSAPRVACRSSECVVVWQDARASVSSPDIYGVTVTRGSVGATPFVVSEAPVLVTLPAIAANASDYLITWNFTSCTSTTNPACNPDVVGNWFSPAGVPVYPQTLRMSASTQEERQAAGVSYAAGNYWFGWVQGAGNSLGSSTGHIVTGRVARDGTRMDRFGIPVETGPSDTQFPTVGSFSQGTHFVSYWRRNDQVQYGIRYAAGSGARLDSTPITLSARSSTLFSGYASCTARVCLNVRYGGFGNDPVIATRIRDDGTVLDSTPIPIAAKGSVEGVANNGTDWLIAIGLGRTSLSVVRVSAAGVVLDASPVLMATLKDNYPRASVASGSDSYVVTWSDEKGALHAQRVGADGKKLGAESTLATDVGTAAGIAFDGRRYVVAWYDNVSKQMLGRRFSSTLAPLDSAPFVIVPKPALAGSPGIRIFAATDGQGQVMLSYTDAINYHRAVSLKTVAGALGSACQGAPDCLSGLCGKNVCVATLDGGTPVEPVDPLEPEPSGEMDGGAVMGGDMTGENALDGGGKSTGGGGTGPIETSNPVGCGCSGGGAALQAFFSLAVLCGIAMRRRNIS